MESTKIRVAAADDDQDILELVEAVLARDVR